MALGWQKCCHQAGGPEWVVAAGEDLVRALVDMMQYLLSLARPSPPALDASSTPPPEEGDGGGLAPLLERPASSSGRVTFVVEGGAPACACHPTLLPPRVHAETALRYLGTQLRTLYARHMTACAAGEA